MGFRGCSGTSGRLSFELELFNPKKNKIANSVMIIWFTVPHPLAQKPVQPKPLQFLWPCYGSPAAIYVTNLFNDILCCSHLHVYFTEGLGADKFVSGEVGEIKSRILMIGARFTVLREVDGILNSESACIT